MTYSISLNSFKKVAAVATFLATAACLVPESAQARPAMRGSGFGNCDVVSFLLDISEQSNKTSVPGAILEASFAYDIDGGGECNEKGQVIFDFNSGDIDNFSPITDIDLQQSPLNNNEGFKNGVKFQSSWLSRKIKSDLEKPAFIKLDFFVPYKINSLSDLNKYTDAELNKIVLTYSVYGFNTIPARKAPGCQTDDEGFMCKGFVSLETPGAKGVSLTEIPEPGTTSSMLGLGALGAVLLVKRSKYLR
jgi:hypothetical protein